jgi:hypothetical protein
MLQVNHTYNGIEGNKKQSKDGTRTKTFMTDLKVPSTKPSNKDLQSKTTVGSKKGGPSKYDDGKARTGSKQGRQSGQNAQGAPGGLDPGNNKGEGGKNDYMKALFGIVKQQSEMYDTLFKSNNKEAVNKLFEGLENYPVYSLHRERQNKLHECEVMYARLLNILTNKRMELERKYKGLSEVLNKLQEVYDTMPLEVIRDNEIGNRFKKRTCRVKLKNMRMSMCRRCGLKSKCCIP